MNKRQKLVQKQFLDNEAEVLSRLRSVYGQAYEDTTKKIADLDSSIAQLQKAYESVDDDSLGNLALKALGKKGRHMTPDEAKETLQSMLQSKVYQKQYQQALQKQVDGILGTMQEEAFTTVSDYLDKCYEDGFIGTMYDLQGQGIPLIMPLDQEAMVRAVQLDSKISGGLYKRMGEDVATLKKHITNEISRGISTGMSYQQIAQQLSFKMVGTGYKTGGALARAMTIARTEGHRIQVQGGMDACYKAKEKGADVVKQWDSTLDAKTRDSHVSVDGEVRELDDKFSNGLMFPGDPAGGAAQVVNCRCALLQRARWAMDEDELKTLQERAEYFGVDKSDSFEDFKKNYLKAVELEKTEQNVPFQAFKPAKTIEQAKEFAKSLGVQYVEYDKLPLETANNLNQALVTLPDDARPIFVGDSKTLEAYWGGSLPRSSKTYYGVTIQTFDGIHLGYGKGWVDTDGYMVGISSSYKKPSKIAEAKAKAQAQYVAKHNGQKYFFNEDGEATAFHEMGHVYAHKKGIPAGFEQDALRWAKESGCDLLSKTSEAWAEAWGAYHTGNPDLPEYIAKYVKAASSGIKPSSFFKGLTEFDDNAIMVSKIEEFTTNLRDGKIRTIISRQKQARHIQGSAEFSRYVEQLSKTGDKPSYIREDLTLADLSAMVKDKLGTGIVESKGDNSFQEFFDCDDVVGYYFDKESQTYKQTRRVQVKYSVGDGNIHIIPVKEQQGGKHHD